MQTLFTPGGPCFQVLDTDLNSSEYLRMANEGENCSLTIEDSALAMLSHRFDASLPSRAVAASRMALAKKREFDAEN